MAQVYLATFEPPTALDESEAWASITTANKEGITIDICLPTEWLDESRCMIDEGTYFVSLEAVLAQYLQEWEAQEGDDAKLDMLATLLETYAKALRDILAQKVP